MRFDRRTVNFTHIEDNEDNIYIPLKELSRSIGVKVSNIKNTINNNIDEYRKCIIIKTDYEDNLYQQFTLDNNLLKISSINILINEEGVYSYTMISRTPKGKEFRIKTRKHLRDYRLGKLKDLARHDPNQPTQLDFLEGVLNQLKLQDHKHRLLDSRVTKSEETIQKYQGSMDYKINSILEIIDRTPINNFDKSVIQRKVKQIAELMSGSSDPSSYYKGIWTKFNKVHGTNSYHKLQRIQLPHAINYLNRSIKQLAKTNGKEGLP